MLVLFKKLSFYLRYIWFYSGSPEELALREGDVVTEVEQVDNNWYRGTLNGSTGYFPINYAKVLVSSRKLIMCFLETLSNVSENQCM